MQPYHRLFVNEIWGNIKKIKPKEVWEFLFTWPLSTLLLALTPLLSAFNENSNEFSHTTLLSHILWMIFYIGLIFTIFWLLLKRDIQKSTLYSALIVFILFNYGYVYSFLGKTPITKFTTRNNIVHLLLLFTALIVIFAIIRRTKARITPILSGVLVMALFVFVPICYKTGKIVAKNISQYNYRWDVESDIDTSKIPNENKRDVYYFIFDRYPNNEVLKRYYGYNNSPFISQLKKRGLTTLDKSNSNYPSTAVAVSSLLNMNYHQENTSKEVAVDGAGVVQTVYFEKIWNNVVAKNFKEAGYKYVTLNSWYTPMYHTPTSDVEFKNSHRISVLGKGIEISELNSLITPGSILRPFVVRPIHLFNKRLVSTDLGFFHRSTNIYQLENASKAADVPGNKFVFGHFIIPHPPYVFNRDGTYSTPEQVAKFSENENFLNQLIYLNGEILRIIDAIDARYNEDNKPIIVIQSDEGPYFEELTNKASAFNWKNITDEQAFIKTGTLASFRLPGIDVEKELSEKDLAQVNIFRTIFNRYFGQEYEILDNRNYIYNKNGLDFNDFTDQINSQY